MGDRERGTLVCVLATASRHTHRGDRPLSVQSVAPGHLAPRTSPLALFQRERIRDDAPYIDIKRRT